MYTVQSNQILRRQPQPPQPPQPPPPHPQKTKAEAKSLLRTLTAETPPRYSGTGGFLAFSAFGQGFVTLFSWTTFSCNSPIASLRPCAQQSVKLLALKHPDIETRLSLLKLHSVPCQPQPAADVHASCIAHVWSRPSCIIHRRNFRKSRNSELLVAAWHEPLRFPGDSGGKLP